MFLSTVNDSLLLAVSGESHRLHDAEISAMSVVPAGPDMVFSLSGDATGYAVLARIGPEGAARLGSYVLGSRITSAALAVDGSHLYAVLGTLAGDLASVHHDLDRGGLLVRTAWAKFGVSALGFVPGKKPLRLWAATSDGRLGGFAFTAAGLTSKGEAPGMEAAFASMDAGADAVVTGSVYGHVARLPLAATTAARGARARLHDGRVIAVTTAGGSSPSIVSVGEDRRIIRWTADPDTVPGDATQVSVTRVALAASASPDPADGAVVSVVLDDEARAVLWRTRAGVLDLVGVAGRDGSDAAVGTVSGDGAERGASQVGVPLSGQSGAVGQRRPVRGAPQAVAAARTPAGLDIVTVATMDGIQLHRLRDAGREPRTIARVDGQALVTAVAAAPIGAAGLAVATGSAEGAVEVWAFDGRRFAQASPPTAVGGMDLRVAFIDGPGDELRLVVGEARGNLRLVSAGQEGLIVTVPPWKVSEASITAVSAFSNGEQSLVSAGTIDDEVSFWSVDPQGVTARLAGLRLGSKVLCIGLGSRADAIVWCSQGAVTLTDISGLPVR